jgi:hypothetical protein
MVTTEVQALTKDHILYLNIVCIYYMYVYLIVTRHTLLNGL